jgi:hypothetical protein
MERPIQRVGDLNTVVNRLPQRQRTPQQPLLQVSPSRNSSREVHTVLLPDVMQWADVSDAVAKI